MTKKEIQKRLDQLMDKPRMQDNQVGNYRQQYAPLIAMVKDYFKDDFTVAEIGSYSGGSTEVFALSCKKVFAIDCWADNDNPAQEGITAELGLKNLEHAEGVFDEKMKNYKNVTKIRKLSSEAYVEFEDESLDAVYIDGNHKYDNVVSDIKLYWPKVKWGGIIAGHDYDHNVKMAVDRVIVAPDRIYADGSWLMVKRRRKVFCLGLWKTGTKSIAKALEVLGYSSKSNYWPVVNIGGIFMSADKLHDPETWKDALDEIKSETEKYDAFADTPWHFIYPILHKWYPEARFILTTRRNHEDVYVSEKYNAVLHGGDPESIVREDVINRYHEHNNKVREFFKDKPYHFKEIVTEDNSWEIICDFLNEPIPNVPYPHVNKGIHHDKVYVKQFPPGSGFGLMAIVSSVIGLSASGEKVRVECNGNTPYFDEKSGPNEWEYYFEQPFITGDIKHLPEDKITRDEFTTYNNITPFRKIPSLSTARKNSIERIKVRPHIIEKVDSFYKEHMDKLNVLGIQIRGTDCFTSGHGRDQSLNMDNVYEIVDSKIDAYSKVLLVTDEYGVVERFRARYVGKVLHYDDAILSNDTVAIHQNPSNDKYKIGEDVLVESLLLSKVNYLLAMRSNISLFAWLRGGMDFEMIDNYIKYNEECYGWEA